MEIAIVADDLTGANDTGVQLAKLGIPSVVRLSLEDTGIAGCEAVVFDTDSRGDSPEEAYRKVQEVGRCIRSGGSLKLVYKKIDSTLRGNVGAEIDAIYDLFQPDFVVIAPSFPQNGRVVRDGCLYVEGTLLHETGFVRDPKTPVTDSYVPGLLGKQTNRPIRLVPRSELAQGSRYLQEQVSVWLGERIPYLVFDAETTEDLQTVACLFHDSGVRVVWCGSAGLAGVLSSRLAAAGKDKRLVPASLPAGPVFTVVGSVHVNTRQQLEAVFLEPGVSTIEMKVEAVLQPGESREAEFRRIRLVASEALAGRWDVVLYSSGARDDVERVNLIGLQSGVGPKGVSDIVGAALGNVAAAIIRDNGILKTILTGGDTARQICLHLGVTELELVGEVESGAPLCRLPGERGIFAITKAGGFGDPLALQRFLHFLRRGAQR